MRYRAAAVVLALAAAAAIGQVPMYSDYPWGLVDNGVDKGPVYNLNCKPPLWCSVPSYGDGVIQLGDGGVLPIWVAYANDAGWAERSLRANFSDDAGFADLSGTASFALDAGFALTSGSAGTSLYAFDAGAANYATTAGVAAYALDAGQANYAPQAGNAITAGTATYALDAGAANYATAAGVAAYALDAGAANYAAFAGSAGTATTAAYAADAGNVQCTGCIIADRIASGAIIREKIAYNAVNHTVIEDGGILGNNIIPGGVTSTQIAAGGVATANIATGAVTANEIGALAVTEAKINTGAVTNAKIGALAVDSGKLATWAVTETKISDLAVTNTKIGSGAVSFGKIADGAVYDTKILDGAITNTKIGTGAVTEVKIDTGSVTETKIGTGAVTVNKIGTGAVTEVKIGTGAVTETKIGSLAVTGAKVASQAIDWSKLDDGSPIMAWDEGRGSLLAGRVTYTNGGTLQTPEVNQGYTSWNVTSGTTDFYAETDIQFRTVKDQFVSITYRTGGTTGWASSSTMRLFNMGNVTQQATATMYGDGLWHTAIFDISAFTGTSTIRFDPQDGGAAIGAGATFWVSNVAVGNIGVGPGGGHSLVSYRGAVGINKAVPGVDLDINGGNSQNVWARLNGFSGIPLFATQRAAGTAAAPTIVTDGTEIGRLDFLGYDGSAYRQTALISSYVNGTPGASDMPGRLVFATTSDGAASATERMQITRDGVVAVNKPTAGGGAAIYINGTDTVYQSIATTSGTVASFPQLQIVNYNANGGFPVTAHFNSKGTAASPAALSAGDTLGDIAFYGRGSSTSYPGVEIKAFTSVAPASNISGFLTFSTASASTSTTERVRITENGNVGILNTNPARELSVKGQIVASPAGTGDDVAYNGTFVSTKPSTANQHINLVRAGNRVWSFGFRPSSNTLLIAGGESTDGNFGNSQPFSFSDSGNMGVGTVAPAARLHTSATNENLRMEGTDPWATFYQAGTRKGWFGYGSGAGTTTWAFTNEVAAGALMFDTNGGAYRFTDFNGGGTTGASINNNGDLIRTTSDERLKENISDLPRGLDAVLRMRPVRFQWKDKQSYGDRWDLGFIAQEMISCVPEAVSRNPDGMYSLDYNKLIAVVVGAIQELFDDRTWLARRVQALEDKAEVTEKRLADLEARLAALEAK